MKDRLTRKLINTKENVIDFKGVPSIGSMTDGQIAITKSPNNQLAIHRKKYGKLYKSFMTADGNQVIEKDLTVKNNVTIKNNISVNGTIKLNEDVTIGKKVTGSNQTLSITTEETVGSSVTPDGSLKVYINGTLYQIPVKEV
tara:strand:+ start:504 stop:929 length:426 start_codon:yes stop_codon:yes gene_type:complete